MTYYHGTHVAIAVYAIYECDKLGTPKKGTAKLHSWETIEALQGAYNAALEQSSALNDITNVILASISAHQGRCLFQQDGKYLCVQCIVSEFMTVEENILSMKDYEKRITGGTHNITFDELIATLPSTPRDIKQVQGRMCVGDWDGDVISLDHWEPTPEPSDYELAEELKKQTARTKPGISFTSKYGSENAIANYVIKPLAQLVALNDNQETSEKEPETTTRDTSASSVISLQ